jgi:DNA polymerase-3 subunit epsilon
MIIAGVDLETSGLNEPEHRIIEVAVLLYEYDPRAATSGNPLPYPLPFETKTWRIDPKRNIDAKALAVHGITSNDLIGKPHWETVGIEVADMLDRADVAVAHNGMEFDFDFMIREWERCGHKLPEFLPMDTMLDGRWATPMGTVPNLGALCFACGVEYDPSKAHGATYDVAVMMECFFYGLHRGVFTMPTT